MCVFFTIQGHEQSEARRKPQVLSESGSVVTIMAETSFKEIASDLLKKSVVNLCTYILRWIIQMKGKHYILTIVVTSGVVLKNLATTHTTKLFWAILKVDDKLSQLLQSFSYVFKDKLGTLQGEKVSIHINPFVPSKLCKARSLLYAIKGKVKAQLYHACETKVQSYL